MIPTASFMFLVLSLVMPVDPQESASQTQKADTVTIEKLERGYGEFPKGMTSFGATLCNNTIYVAGGKSGRAHHYARSFQNPKIFSLDLAKTEWTTAGDTLALQGLALVSHEGKLIRIGGLEARNEEGEEHELRSLAAVKAFDPKTKKWNKLPSLPQGRSSIDACVYKNKIYVAGGWTLKIGEDSEWASDMLVLDMDQPEPKWQSVAVPFKTRALASLAFEDKLYVMGGIQKTGGTTRAVHVFDIQKGTWSEGAEIPCEGSIKAFGCSAVTVAGQLLVSTYDGGIYRIDDQRSGWEKVHQLENGRFFHRMVAAGKSSFAIVGGAHMDHGRLTEVEVFSVSVEK